MFLATPLIAVIKIMLSKAEFTQPIANLLAGRLSALSAPSPARPIDG
jgi:hypothetical protein